MKRCPYARNKWRWKWFQSFKRSRIPGLGPYTEIVSHMAFFRDWAPHRLVPMLTPKPPRPKTLFERRMIARMSVKHPNLSRDPRYRPAIADNTF